MESWGSECRSNFVINWPSCCSDCVPTFDLPLTRALFGALMTEAKVIFYFPYITLRTVWYFIGSK